MKEKIIELTKLIRNYLWALLAMLFFVACLLLEFAHTEGNRAYEVFIRMFLALGYGYISASIIYCVVDYIPFERKRKKLRPIIEYKLWKICELLRCAKEVVINPYDMTGHAEEVRSCRAKYIKLFSTTDLDEPVFLENEAKENKITKLDRLESYRCKIDDEVGFLNLYHEFLTEEQMSFLVELMRSDYMRNKIMIAEIPGYTGPSNQEIIGGNIYDMYALARESV